MRKLLGLLGILWVIGFLIFIAYDYAFHEPEAKREMEALAVEASTIAPPPGAAETRHSATHKTRHALVESTYWTAMSYPELRTFYDAQLAAHGWTFVRERPLRDWGRDLGGVSACYRKGAYTVDLQFAGAQASYGWTYALGFSWGLFRE